MKFIDREDKDRRSADFHFDGIWNVGIRIPAHRGYRGNHLITFTAILFNEAERFIDTDIFHPDHKRRIA